MTDQFFCPAQEEASALLSALATALNNCRLAWPAFLPVHDPLRDAWWGIAISGLVTVHYNSDSIHSSKMPDHLHKVQVFEPIAQPVLQYVVLCFWVDLHGTPGSLHV